MVSHPKTTIRLTLKPAPSIVSPSRRTARPQAAAGPAAAAAAATATTTSPPVTTPAPAPATPRYVFRSSFSSGTTSTTAERRVTRRRAAAAAAATAQSTTPPSSAFTTPAAAAASTGHRSTPFLLPLVATHLEAQRASPPPLPPLLSTYPCTPAAATAAPTSEGAATEWGPGWESSWFVGETPELRQRKELLFGEFCTLFGAPSPCPSLVGGGPSSESQGSGLGIYCQGGGGSGGGWEEALYSGGAGGGGAPFPGQYIDG